MAVMTPEKEAELAELRARVAELEAETEKLAEVRQLYHELSSRKFQWSRHYNAEFSLVVKSLRAILER